MNDAFDSFFETGVTFLGFEEENSGEEEFAVEFEDFEKFGVDVGANYVLDSYAGGFYLALLRRRISEWNYGETEEHEYLKKLSHCSPLLLSYGGILLLYHA
jgi:hypothetical protein